MRYIFILTVILFVSCTDPGAKTTESFTDTTAVDGKSTVNANFDYKLFKQLSLPLNIDTNFILKVDTNDRISYRQIRSLGTNFLRSEPSNGLSYNFNLFCEIDSLKEAGKYKEYLDSLTIGMTKKLVIYKIGVIDLKNDTKLFLWGSTNSSYEACPFFSGTYILATFVNTKKENTHFLLAAFISSGDPPSMSNVQITAKINTDGTIEMMSKMVGDDLDTPGEETTTQKFNLKLDGDHIGVRESKAEVKNTEKPKQ